MPRRFVAHAEARAHCGIAGPRLLETDGETQRSRRRFPTIGGTLVRRTPVRKLVRDVEAAQPGHYLADLPDGPVECDWMLGACLLLRRPMVDDIGGFDEGFPMYGEDIELQYRASLRGLGALVRARRARDARLPARRRPHVPLAPHLVAPAGHGPLRAQAPRDARAYSSYRRGSRPGARGTTAPCREARPRATSSAASPEPSAGRRRAACAACRRALSVSQAISPSSRRPSATSLGELADRDVVAGADVDGLRGVVVLEQEHDRAGQVVDVQELALRGAGAPDRDAARAPFVLGVVEAADQGGQHVRGLPGRSCRRGRRGWWAWRRSSGGRTACAAACTCRMPAILAIA